MSRTTSTADRIAVAVDLLDPQPDEYILEAGCGHGVALDLVARRLKRGRITGLDRSPKMIASATRRNAVHLAAGRAELSEAAIESWQPEPGAFDAAFAINVIAFAGSDHGGTAVVYRALRSGGRFCLVFQPPATRHREVVAGFDNTLRVHGFDIDRSEVLDRPGGSLAVVVGRKRAQA